jgi:hypothetical protein
MIKFIDQYFLDKSLSRLDISLYDKQESVLGVKVDGTEDW